MPFDHERGLYVVLQFKITSVIKTGVAEGLEPGLVYVYTTLQTRVLLRQILFSRIIPNNSTYTLCKVSELARSATQQIECIITRLVFGTFKLMLKRCCFYNKWLKQRRVGKKARRGQLSY